MGHIIETNHCNATLRQGAQPAIRLQSLEPVDDALETRVIHQSAVARLLNGGNATTQPQDP